MGTCEVFHLDPRPLQPNGGVMWSDLRGIDDDLTRRIAACDHRSLLCMKRTTCTRVVQSQFKNRFHDWELIENELELVVQLNFFV
jgi:hypothetical protein